MPSLSVVKRRWTTRNLLGVNVVDMNDALFYTHVQGLPSLKSQASLDTLKCFVRQETLDYFLRGVFDYL